MLSSHNKVIIIFMEIKTIANIHTDFPEKFGIPRQSGLIDSLKGRIVFLPEFRNPEALRGITEFSHLWLIWGFSEVHRKNWSAAVAPPRLGGKKKIGVFATRSPFRPNPTGLSCVHLDAVEYDKKLGPVLIVSGVDMLDNTPIYDIKPYLAYTDSHPDASGGFADDVYSHHLDIVFPDHLLSKLTESEQSAVIQILSQDPRTAFIHDPSRIWGIAFASWNIRFTVSGNVLTVCSVSPYSGSR